MQGFLTGHSGWQSPLPVLCSSFAFSSSGARHNHLLVHPKCPSLQLAPLSQNTQTDSWVRGEKEKKAKETYGMDREKRGEKGGERSEIRE